MLSDRKYRRSPVEMNKEYQRAFAESLVEWKGVDGAIHYALVNHWLGVLNQIRLSSKS